MSELGPSPLAAGDKNLSVAEARAAIAASLTPIAGDETVDLPEALGRVLAQDLLSPIDVPAHDNSAMDGYAFDGALLRDDAPLDLPVQGTVYAGQPFAGVPDRLAALRIMTGAVMPPGHDTVVPQELASAGDGRVRIEPGAVRRGDNRRRRGEDLSAGRPALHAGRLLRPADMGLIASLGIESVRVRRRLRVALFSTGDELRSPGQALDAGCVYDSNRSSLRAALQRLGVEVVDLGLVPDDPAALQATLEQAIAQADAVLTSGGVSVGEADHTRALLARLGEVAFWKVAMRPGRPFAFGPLRAADGGPRWLFALPGNPVAALVTFYVFAREALLQLAGATPQPLPVLRARSVAPIRKRPGRTEFQRAVVSPGTEGWQVQTTGTQGAGILRSMSEANALLVLGHEQGSVAAGEFVDVWLFDGLA
ncbi:gephyrin-like molybdotransferase Glp [Aquincola sp. MAHUQ-54]|uniref:Molybdopterin molybdenumtransferase n=1 Tax=Aquincola agrisoli TaxID=3119538 RepID=A0AAW9QM73_9BURK